MSITSYYQCHAGFACIIVFCCGLILSIYPYLSELLPLYSEIVPLACHEIWVYESYVFVNTLQWRHNKRDGVSNHQPHDCLPNRYKAQIKENIKAPRHWPLCGEFTGPVTRKIFSFDYVIMITSGTEVQQSKANIIGYFTNYLVRCRFLQGNSLCSLISIRRIYFKHRSAKPSSILGHGYVITST